MFRCDRGVVYRLCEKVGEKVVRGGERGYVREEMYERGDV